jgi:eukaryotic-like serine/threonine-protein kinase
MPLFTIPLAQAAAMFPEYTFVRALTPSAQKAAFHVRDSQGRDLCLKIISPDYERDRLDREIQALQSLDHPNVVKLIEYTFSSKPGHQRHYLIEEFVDGSDLKDILLPGQPWTLTNAATFFATVCDGLAALKDKEIVHRDIKPENIRVRTGGTPVLIDFGLARHLSLPDLTQTVLGAAIGTPLYFAPEQFDGTKHDIDHRTDLFALGILLYEALTGEHPFYRPSMTTRAQLRQAVCESNAHLARGSFLALDPKWRTLLTRLLEKDRSKRPSNASQVATILRKLGGA